jgi:hypothetical protein
MALLMILTELSTIPVGKVVDIPPLKSKVSEITREWSFCSKIGHCGKLLFLKEYYKSSGYSP